MEALRAIAPRPPGATHKNPSDRERWLRTGLFTGHHCETLHGRNLSLYHRRTAHTEKEDSRMRRCGVLILACLFVVGCGGDGSPTAPSNPPFTQTMTGTVSVFGWVRHPLTIPRTGNMSLRLTWQSAAVDLDLFLAPASCTELYPKAACGILAASDAATGTQEQINRTVNVGEQYQIFVDSLSLDQTQNYTLTLTID